MDTVEDIMLDNQGGFVTASDGDVQTVRGAQCIAQDVRHRLETFPGDLWVHLTYGAGLQYYLSAEDSDVNRQELEQTIRMELKKEVYVKPGSVRVSIQTWERDVIRVAVTFDIDVEKLDSSAAPSAETASIVLTISQTGIEYGGDAA